MFSLSVFSLSYCRITEKQCLILTSALKSNPSHLRELNLSWNKLLGDSGVKNLSDLLMNTQFKLEKLELVSLYSTAVTVRLMILTVVSPAWIVCSSVDHWGVSLQSLLVVYSSSGSVLSGVMGLISELKSGWDTVSL